MRKCGLPICAVCAILYFVSSCAGITNLVATPSVSLESNNFEYVRDVEGETTYTYVFGIGGMREKNASDRLVKNANLKPGEALANVSILTKTKVYFLGLVVLKVIQAHAQVVRFTDVTPISPAVSSYIPGSNLRATEEDDEAFNDGDKKYYESVSQPQVEQQKTTSKSISSVDHADGKVDFSILENLKKQKTIGSWDFDGVKHIQLSVFFSDDVKKWYPKILRRLPIASVNRLLTH